MKGMVGTGWTVFVKEMRELFRDHRTILVMLVVPVLLYPAVFIGVEQIALAGLGSSDAPDVVAVSPDLAEGAIAALQRMNGAEVRLADDPGALVRQGRADVAVVGGRLDAAGELRASVVYDPGSTRSAAARGRVREALGEWGNGVLAERLQQQGLPRQWARPVALADSAAEAGTGPALHQAARFLPLLLVIITLLGTFYPALDLGAGEKERGTLESLLTAPVPHSHLIAGKFATVAVVGFVAAAANLASMLLTLKAGLFGATDQLPVGSFSAGAVLLMFATLVPLGILFAGVFLGVSMRAQSLKEAQSALTPAYMLILIPAMLPALPGIHLTLATALVPVGGMVLLFAGLLTGTAPAAPAMVAVLATVGYALAGLSFAARGLGSEETLFGRDDAPQTAGGSLLRRVFVARGHHATPPLRQALGLVIAVAVLYFYGARLLLAALGIDNPLLATGLAEWLLMFVPAALFLRRTTASPLATLGLDRAPRSRDAAGALALALGGLPVAWFLGWVQTRFLPLPTHLAQALEPLLHVESPLQVAGLFAAVALTPAVCEELVFRGALLSGSRGEMSGVGAVALNAAVFGGFHLSTETAIRFLPTAWMGLLLATVVWRTRSLWLSMAMHLLYNGTLVWLALRPGVLGAAGTTTAPPPPALVGGSVLLLGLGWLLIRGEKELAGAAEVRAA